MKKVKYLIIFITLMFLGFNIVNAKTAGYIVTSDLFTTSGIKARMHGLKVNDIWTSTSITSPYSPTLLFIKENTTDAKSVPAYCANPAKGAGVKNTGEAIEDDGRLLKVFINKTGSSDLKKASTSEQNVYDAGLIYILQNGYDKSFDGNVNTYFSNANDRVSALATTNALRLYRLLFLKNNDNTMYSTDYCPLQKYLAVYYNFLADEVFGKAYGGTNFNTILTSIEGKLEPGVNNLRQQITYNEQALANFACSGDISSYKMGKIDAYESGSFVDKTTLAKEETLKLLMGALKEIEKILTVESSAPSVLGVKQQGELSNESGGTQTKKIEYKMATYNFNSGEVYAKLNVKTSVAGLNYSMSYKTASGTYSVDSTDNLMQWDKNGTLILEFSADKDDLICQKIEYDLVFEYTTPLISADVHYGHKENKPAGSVQTLYFLLAPENRTETINDDFTLCEWQDDCRYLKDSCEIKYSGNASSMACKKFDENFNSKCAVCTLDATLPSCTEVDTELYLNEATAYDADATDKLQCNTARDSVLDCVIRGKDPADNSYEATNILAGNPYCKVFCKEDYHIGLPGQQKSTAGRYFTLSASISGAKTCYTGRIDKNKLEQDINQYKAEFNSAAGNLAAQTIAFEKQEKAIEQYNKCFNWANDFKYNYDPKIKFEYEEEYFDLLDSSKNEFVAFDLVANEENTAVDSITPDPKKAYYYTTNNMPDDYCKNSIEGDCASKSTIADVGTTSITLSNGSSKTIPNANYVKLTQTVDGFYQTPSHYYSLSSYRTIAVPPDESAVAGTPAQKLENQLPVATNTAMGIYNYSIKIENLGEYYNDETAGHAAGSLGRIWGAENSVVDVITSNAGDANNQHVQCLKNQLGNITTSNVDLTETNTNSAFVNGVYVCNYQIGENEKHCEKEKDENGNTILYVHGKIVDQATYEAECGGDTPYKCEIVDGKYYDSNGTETTEALFRKDCYSCYYDETNNKYYDKNGVESEANYKAQCLDDDNDDYVCKKIGDEYFGIKGEIVSEDQYYQECNSCKKESGKYYGLSGKEVTEAVYKEQCLEACKIIGEVHYYYGEVVTEEQWNKVCDPCPDCPTDCEPPCEFDDCPEGDCPVECENCLFKDGNLNVDFRPVTNNNINPNNRPLGNNWAVDDPTITLHPDTSILTGVKLDSAMELKAIVTTYEIQEDGELIYDSTINDNQTLKVTLDRALLNDIKAANSLAEATGGYASNTLACYDYTIGSKVYKNVFCYSTFLDELIQNHGTNFEFTIPDGGQRLETQTERENNSLGSKYWKTWVQADKTKWDVMTNYGIVANDEGFGTVLNVGPSWK